MMNNGNEMVDSDTNCIVNCNTPANANNESSPTSKNPKYYHKILKYFTCFTAQVTRSNRKKFNTGKQSADTYKREEKIVTRAVSLSSIVGNVIKPDAEAVANNKIEEETIDAATARFGEVCDKVMQNLSDVRHFAPCTSYRYAEYVAARYVDNAMPTHSCCPLCVGTQCSTVDGEFSLTIRPDAFAKARKPKQHADFAPEEIENVPGSLTKKARFVSDEEKPALTSVLMSSTFEPEEEIFETKPLIISIIRAEKKTIAAAEMIAVRSETLKNTQERDHFASDLINYSTDLDESLNIQVVPVRRLKEMERTHSTSIMYPEDIDFQDIAANTTDKEKNEKEKESTLNEHVFKKNIQTDALKRDAITIKNRAIESSIKTLHTKEKFKEITKNVLQESTSYKKPKYRAKYHIDDSNPVKDGTPKEIKAKKVRVSDDFNKPLKCRHTRLKTIGSPRSFDYFKKLAIEESPRYLQPLKRCKDLIPKICLERLQYYNVSNIPCFSWQNKATKNITLSHYHCPQDFCNRKCTCWRPSVDAAIIDCRAKRSLTFENVLPATARCKNDAKCCHSYLSNIDNFRRGCYHWNDSRPEGNDNQHCGRDRSHYRTKENSYLTHPWTPTHLLLI
ncbi:hypothetical protein PUN28_013267 [Cardiocondyla obscurior]|uniref:Uncharacterized protein n=1 Tax=Cardiocondyla obscurior TaxID=286306 RepID=A0AAW2F9Q3_9HYME